MTNDPPLPHFGSGIDTVLARALFQAAGSNDEAPPLRIDAALSARPAGAWIGFTGDDQISPLEAYRREADKFEALLRSLSPDEWKRAVVTYGDSRGLIAHLVAIEHYVGAQARLWASRLDERADHLTIGRDFVSERAHVAPADVLDEWRSLVQAVLAAFAADPSRLNEPATWHGAPIDFAALLLIRTFEVWTHGDDVRRAVGRSLSTPDHAQLKLMTNLAAAVLPLGLASIGRVHTHRTLRLVLTGPGGGTWRIGLAPDEPPAPADDVLLVADAVDFCRLAANRLRPDELAPYVEGDAALVSDVLTGVAALAVD